MISRIVLFSILAPITIVTCLLFGPGSVLGAPNSVQKTTSPEGRDSHKTVCVSLLPDSIKTADPARQGSQPASLGISRKGLLPHTGVGSAARRWQFDSSPPPAFGGGRRRTSDRLKHLLDEAVQEHRRLEAMEEELELLKVEKRELEEQLKGLLNARIK